jgi:hypothetical protein
LVQALVLSVGICRPDVKGEIQVRVSMELVIEVVDVKGKCPVYKLGTNSPLKV